ncbi:MAG TPA: class I SAM-dependent methyltransferase [Methylomirabilota bacterium]|jgi:SAM-dependent methyltransferase|nr:class I SAM-dependent methyltransferase [Methylomirabilota bacterium]
MPVSPPVVEAEDRFDPIYVTPDDLDDLATFTGLSREACLTRLREYSSAEMVEAWRRADPRTAGDILRFYQSTDLYVWELMQWHASPSRSPYWETLGLLAERFPATVGFRRVYDFGCGVGTDALFLAERGYEVALVDVEGPAFRFARHRFARRGRTARFLPSASMLPEPDGVYDVAICFDVFEHLPEPLEAARRLITALRPGGLLVEKGSFSGSQTHPYHLEGHEARYGGLRWHCWLSGLGLRYVGGSAIHRRVDGAGALVQRARYGLWRATGLWVLRV